PVWPGTPCWGALPVSPVEIDSMLRLARSIRYLLEKERTRDYPFALDAARAHAEVIQADWLPVVPGGVAVIRPPSAAELDTAIAQLGAFRKRVAAQVSRRGEVEPIERLVTGL